MRGSDDGRWLLLQRLTTVAASASETPRRCGQGRQGAGGGIAEGAQRRQQCGQEDMDPLIGFALAHAE